jgi:histidinol-phosphate/aromatic aminotransferase/cobyric acid decarboxylase-like protein
MALTRRGFVQTVGIGAAGAFTSSWIGARGRENALWSALEPTLHAVEPGVTSLASNENPVGPGGAVLDAVKAAFGTEAGRPAGYSNKSKDLIDAIAKKQGVNRERRPRLRLDTDFRSATHLLHAKDRPLVGVIPTYESAPATRR